MPNRVGWGLTAIAVLALGAPAQARDEALAERIDPLVAPAIEGEWLSGAVVGVVVGDETLVLGYGRGVGEAPPDGDTVYEIGSVSKTFTGVLLAYLVGRGIVTLEDPVEGLLPRGVTVPRWKGEEVRLWHLSTHTSGLPRMPDNFAPKDPENPYADYSVWQMYAFLERARLAHEPGGGYEYSNVAAGLLGHVLALKEKMPYEELLARRITAPLGMRSTRIALTEEMRARLAPPLLADGTPTKNWDLPTIAGAGGIRSTVNDMLLYVRAHLRPGDDDLGRAMRLARTPRHPIPGGEIGLGWHLTDKGVVWHNGQTGGYHSYVGFDPERGTGVVILANNGSGVPDLIGVKVLEALGGGRPAPPDLPAPAKVDEAVLEACVGRYALARGTILTVSRQGSRLYAQLTGQARFRLFAASDREYAYRIVEARITFVVDGDGRPTDLVLHQNGRDMRAPRIED